MRKIIAMVLFTITGLYATAQNAVPAENTDVMRSNGKIYVVLAVVVTIMCGLFLYVFSLDKKISRLEKK